MISFAQYCEPRHIIPRSICTLAPIDWAINSMMVDSNGLTKTDLPILDMRHHQAKQTVLW